VALIKYVHMQLSPKSDLFRGFGPRVFKEDTDLPHPLKSDNPNINLQANTITRLKQVSQDLLYGEPGRVQPNPNNHVLPLTRKIPNIIDFIN